MSKTPECSVCNCALPINFDCKNPQCPDNPSLFVNKLRVISAEDVGRLVAAQQTYGDSWRKRGGAGAFMVTARKWDRLEQMCEQNGWDIFEAAKAYPGTKDEGLLDQIRDLRCYLLLWEREIRGKQ